MMKAIIYNRTSTKEQNPALQLKDCLEFCKNKSLEVIEVKEEQGSAYKKDKHREVWESVVNRAKKERLNIVVWRYDRAFRNRKEFYEFMKVMFEVYEVKVYSATEPSVISFWNMLSETYSDNPVMNELIKGIFQTLWNFIIQQAGEEAEEESRKKSLRTKLAVVKSEGEKTRSYKGNLWGRKPISKQAINKVLELRKQGLTIRDIAKQVSYAGKNNKSKNVSIALVHKIITEKRDDLSTNNLE